MKQKNMILLNYAIDTIIKLCYYITINREQGRNKKMKEIQILRNIVFTYFLGELEMDPIQARKKVDSMTDEEIEKFLD
jgi:hypothetical protein